MPTIFFLPWVRSRERIDFPSLSLIPHERGKLPGTLGTISQHQLDAVIGNYGEPYRTRPPHYQHVSHSVIVHWPGTVFGQDIADAQIQSRMEVGQLITVAALSERGYGSPLGYTNSDSVGMVGQPFTELDPSAVAAQSRRRDGVANHGMSGSLPIKFVRPLHVSAHGAFDPDKRLLGALLQARSSGKLAPHVVDAISIYNRANTDADGSTDAVDLVLHRVALEALVGASDKMRDLREKLIQLAGLKSGTPRWFDGVLDEHAWKARWPDAKRPFEAWVADFCNSRNRHAHGRKGFDYTANTSVWSDQNHLMFVSWLFPLLLKKVLTKARLYVLTDIEKDYLARAEMFMAHDVSAWNGQQQKWGELEQEFVFASVARQLTAQFNRTRPSRIQ